MELNLVHLTNTYVQCCSTEGMSPQTILSYQTDLKRFNNFLMINNLSNRIADIGLAEIRSYIYYLQNNVKRWDGNPNVKSNKRLSPTTVHDYARSLKCFWSWLFKEGYVEKNLIANFKLPKAPRRIIATFSPEQIAKILSTFNTDTRGGFRDFTILLLFIDTGIRLSELINLELEALDFARSCFKVRGKGDKERIVPFGSQVRKSLIGYINKIRPEPDNPQITQLFLTRDGLPLQKRHVQYMVSEVCQKAGITGIRCSPHTFRHSFARQYLMNGGDIFSLQRILGHSSLEVVKIYINLASSDILQQHHKYSPLDNMMLGGKTKTPRVGRILSASAKYLINKRSDDRQK